MADIFPPYQNVKQKKHEKCFRSGSQKHILRYVFPVPYSYSLNTCNMLPQCLLWIHVKCFLPIHRSEVVRRVSLTRVNTGQRQQWSVLGSTPGDQPLDSNSNTGTSTTATPAGPAAGYAIIPGRDRSGTIIAHPVSCSYHCHHGNQRPNDDFSMRYLGC